MELECLEQNKNFQLILNGSETNLNLNKIFDPNTYFADQIHLLKSIMKVDLNVFTIFIENKNKLDSEFFSKFITLLLNVDDNLLDDGLLVLNEITLQIPLTHYMFSFVYIELSKLFENPSNSNKNLILKCMRMLKILYTNISLTNELKAHSFFYFKPKSKGINLATQHSQFLWHFENSICFMTWFTKRQITPATISILFSFHSEKFGGLEAYFFGDKLFYRILPGGIYTFPDHKSTKSIQEIGEFQNEKTYFLVIDHQKKLIKNSLITSINGQEYINIPYDYPKIPSGTPMSRSILFENFYGTCQTIIITSASQSIPKSTILYNNYLPAGIQTEKLFKIFFYNYDKSTKNSIIFTPIRCGPYDTGSIVYDTSLYEYKGVLQAGVGCVIKEAEKQSLSHFKSYSPLLVLMHSIQNYQPPTYYNILNGYLKLLVSILKLNQFNQEEAKLYEIIQQLGGFLKRMSFNPLNEETIEILLDMRKYLSKSVLKIEILTYILFEKDIYTKLDFELQELVFITIKNIYIESPIECIKHFDIEHILRDLHICLNDKTQNFNDLSQDLKSKYETLVQLYLNIIFELFRSLHEELIENGIDLIKILPRISSCLLKEKILILFEKILIEKKNKSEAIYEKMMKSLMNNGVIEIMVDVALTTNDTNVRNLCFRFENLYSNFLLSKGADNTASVQSLKYFSLFEDKHAYKKVKLEESKISHSSKLNYISDTNSNHNINLFSIGNNQKVLIPSLPSPQNIKENSKQLPPSSKFMFPADQKATEEPVDEDENIPKPLSLSRGKKSGGFSFPSSGFQQKNTMKNNFVTEKIEEPIQNPPKLSLPQKKNALFKGKGLALDIDMIEQDNENTSNGDAMRHRNTPRTMARQEKEIITLAAKLAEMIRLKKKIPYDYFPDPDNLIPEESQSDTSPAKPEIQKPANMPTTMRGGNHTISFQNKSDNAEQKNGKGLIKPGVASKKPIDLAIINESMSSDSMSSPHQVQDLASPTQEDSHLPTVENSDSVIKISKNVIENSENLIATNESHNFFNENTYITLMEWALNRSSIPFSIELVLNKEDKIQNAVAIEIIKKHFNLFDYSLKEKILNDWIFLLSNSYQNVLTIFTGIPNFIDFLLEALLDSFECHQDENEKKNKKDLLKIYSLFLELVSTVLTKMIKEDTNGIQKIMNLFAWVEKKIAIREKDNRIIICQLLIKKILIQVLDKINEISLTIRPMLASVFWKNTFKLIFMIFEAVILNPPKLNSHQKFTEFPLENLSTIFSDLSPYLFVVPEEASSFCNLNNIEHFMTDNKSYIDFNLLHNLLKIGERFWSDGFFTYKSKLSQEIQTLERKLAAVLDQSLQKEFILEAEMLLFSSETMPQINIIFVFYVSNLLLIDYEFLHHQNVIKNQKPISNQTNLQNLLYLFEKMVKYFMVVMENSKNVNDLPKKKVDFIICIISSAIKYLYEKLGITDLNSPVRGLFKQTLKNIFIYIIFVIDLIHAKGGNFSSYPDIKKNKSAEFIKNKGIASQQPLKFLKVQQIPYNLIFHEMFWNYLRVGPENSDPIISITMIKQLKTNDLDGLDMIIYSDLFRRAFVQNETVKNLQREYFSINLLAEIKKYIDLLRKSDQIQKDQLQLTQDQNEEFKKKYKLHLDHIHTSIITQLEEKKNIEEAFRTKNQHYYISQLKKFFNDENSYQGYWNANKSAYQNNLAFRASQFSYEQINDKPYYFKFRDMLSKIKTRPFIKIKLKKPFYPYHASDPIFCHINTNLMDNQDKSTAEKKGIKYINHTNFFQIQASTIKLQNKIIENENENNHLGLIGKSIKDTLLSMLPLKQIVKEVLVSKLCENDKRIPVDIVFDCELIKTLTTRKGYLAFSENYLYFLNHSFTQTKTHTNLLQHSIKPFENILKEYLLTSIREIQIRRHLMYLTGIELFFLDGKFILINLLNESSLQEFCNFVLKNNKRFPNLIYHKTFEFSKLPDASGMAKKWVEGVISNFEYLLYLNSVSSRSYKDLAQYPIMPWIISNYASEEFDSGNFNNFRDLSKPMGALGNINRINHFIKRFEDVDPFNPGHQYHYGSHYSNPAIICQYLLRVLPYTRGALEIQNGKFDIPDRLFHNIEDGYKSVTEEISDIRELIPEFYYFPECLLNIEKHNFGISQSNQRIHNVILPKWAKENPYIFVSTMRRLLESDFVSSSLHNWIDLIFGYKQSGEEAAKALNVFYPLTYEENYQQITNENLSDEDKISKQSQIYHFGQTPQKIFSKPHPKKNKKRYIYKIITDIAAVITVYKPKDKKDMNISKFNNKFFQNWHFFKDESLINLKFAGESKLFGLKKNGSIIVYRWWNSSSALLPAEENKLTFSNGIEGEKKLNFEDHSPDNFLLFDKSVRNIKSPCVFFEKNKSLLMGGYWGGLIALFNVESASIVKIFEKHKSTVTAIEVDSKENFIISGSKKGEVILWKAVKNNFMMPRNVFYDHSDEITSFWVSLELTIFASSSYDGLIFMYNLFNGNRIRCIQHPECLPINQVIVASTPLACVILFSSEDKSLYSFSVNGQLIEKVTVDFSLISAACILKDPQFSDVFIYGNDKGEIQFRDIPYLERRVKYEVFHSFPPLCITFNQDKRFLLSGSQEGDIFILTDKTAYNHQQIAQWVSNIFPHQQTKGKKRFIAYFDQQQVKFN